MRDLWSFSRVFLTSISFSHVKLKCVSCAGSWVSCLLGKAGLSVTRDADEAGDRESRLNYTSVCMFTKALCKHFDRVLRGLSSVVSNVLGSGSSVKRG